MILFKCGSNFEHIWLEASHLVCSTHQMRKSKRVDFGNDLVKCVCCFGTLFGALFCITYGSNALTFRLDMVLDVAHLVQHKAVKNYNQEHVNQESKVLCLFKRTVPALQRQACQQNNHRFSCQAVETPIGN